MATRINGTTQLWKGTSGLSSGAQLISATASHFIAPVANDTSAIPPWFEEIDFEALENSPPKVVGFADLFQLVTEQYKRGGLTLGEAAELLGMNR
ncbi:MAG: hypothetical protein HY314_00920 [Acidobacteria bacterium]|nr:hypothetical protein [Acidobacteriota bacterium]